MDGSIMPGVEPQPPTPSPPKKRHFILGCLGIALGLFLAFFRAWAWSYGMMTAEAWGYAAGGAVLPALIAYAIAGRKSVRNFNRFGVWFSGLSLFFLVVASAKPVSLQQHIGNLMKEAAGTKPVDNSGPGTFDNFIREMMRGVLEDRKAFERETAPLAPELTKLYSAETFASKPAMQKSIDAVHGIVAADERYSKQLEGIPERMQAYADRSHFSESDKRDFMAGVRTSFGDLKALKIRREAMEVEKQWESATVALYEFALAHASKIRVDGTRLLIADRQTLARFNEQSEKAQKLREDLSQLNTQLESAQHAALQQAGITPKDLGIEGDQPDKK